MGDKEDPWKQLDASTGIILLGDYLHGAPLSQPPHVSNSTSGYQLPFDDRENYVVISWT